jgi:hypothetical protein
MPRLGLRLGRGEPRGARLVQLPAALPAADAEHAQADREHRRALEDDRAAHAQRRVRAGPVAQRVLDEQEDEPEQVPAVRGRVSGARGGRREAGAAHPKKRSAEDVSAFRVSSTASSSETGRSGSDAQPMTPMTA